MRLWALRVCIFLLSLTPRGAEAQQRFVPGDTVLVRPARQYEAGALHRWLMGDGYRDLWSVEIPVEVLDLRTYAGGLEPIRLGGGQQTQSIRFQGSDGLVYTFRSVDKNARRGLDPVLRNSLAADVMQDQISSLMPLSAMVVSEILDAAGLFHPQPRLVVMPDDPRLGEYMVNFAGVLGWIELRPDEGEDDTPGFAGSERVVGSDRLYERLEEESDNLVDQRAFLKARYIDFLVGDWDRHPDQWRWAGFPDTIGARDVTLFQPVPRDRDWALARLDGLIQTVASVPYPQYVGFSADFPDPLAASWNGRGLDRRLMSELDSADFAEVARELTSALTHEVIERAVRQLPDAYYALEGATIERALKARRDQLVDFAERYYDLLARWVDVAATDEDEYITIDRADDGSMTLTIFDLRNGEPRPEPYYQRTFRPSHTEEVRLYAQGGDDRIEVLGSESSDPIRLRVVSGGGDDIVDDQTSGQSLAVHDHRGDNEFRLGRAALLDERAWEPADDPAADLHGARSRDWGSMWSPSPVIGANPDEGLIIGTRMSRIGYDFRHFPWQNQLDVAVSVGTATWRPNASLTWEAHTPARRFRAQYELTWRGARADRFYGFGNDTRAPGDDDLYRARRSELGITARLLASPIAGASVGFEAGYRRFDAQENRGTIIAAVDPYGYGEFDQFEVTAFGSLDRRDDPWHPRSGFRADLTASFSPSQLDVVESYGFVDADLAAYFGSTRLPLEPTLALRALGRRTFGTAPYFAGASLGGGNTLRGYRNQRYLGDASLAGSAEVRASVSDFFLLFPGELGVLGLADAGRVWVDGTSEGEWHATGGFGLWATLVDQYALSLTMAKGEIWGVYFALGMPF